MVDGYVRVRGLYILIFIYLYALHDLFVFLLIFCLCNGASSGSDYKQRNTE